MGESVRSGYFSTERKKERIIRKIQAMAKTLEGDITDLELTSMLTGLPVSGVDGVQNKYRTYSAQVTETYRKYNGKAEFGSQQIRSVADLRTAFIGGEGVSVSSENENTSEWINNFLKSNKMDGSLFMYAVLGSELSGKSVLYLDGENILGYPKVGRLSFRPSAPYKPAYRNQNDPESIYDILVKGGEGEDFVSFKKKYFVFIKTGGDDTCSDDTTTKIGIILTDAENYDKASKDMRRLNHITARITPTFKTGSLKETNELLVTLGGEGGTKKWKMGEAYAGTAEFDYKTPSTGAHDNLSREASLAVKTIASTTGVPVHWIGWVDLMSNRSTAESLYDTLGNATSIERTTWEEAMYELIIKAQEDYINRGGTEITAVDKDFTVRIPVIDFTRFLQTVSALSTAYNDNVISRGDYQNLIPGINPLETNKALAEEAQKEFNAQRTSIEDIDLDIEGENDV